ncbi:MAG TPA: response regulator transcription factor [Candidatus Binatia bacterium]|nr:response regulator transcription factor [Candidatus Binatia bacterium]
MAADAPTDRILLVEDDPDLREAMTELLESEGYEVDTAAEGQAAFEQMRSSPPDLILLDLMLPVMDGFEFRVRQMQEPRLAAIPVIVFSGGGDLEQKAASLHAAACFAKPIDVARLLEVIDQGVKTSPVRH